MHGAVAREWLIARIVVIGGLIIAAIAVIWFGWLQPTLIIHRLVERKEEQKQALVTAVSAMCDMGLTAAKNFGIVPAYGQMATNSVYTTNVRGRYICIAATHAARYLVAVDLLCKDFKNKRCISLYSVTQTDGTVLYQRQS